MLKEEKAEVKKLCNYLDKLGIFYFAIPAVSFRKGQGGFPIGYKKSMPDLCIPRWKLFIEMKALKAGKVKEHDELQLKRHEELKNEGCSVIRCEGFEIAKKFIDDFLQKILP